MFIFLDFLRCIPPPNPDNGYFTPIGIKLFRPRDRIWFECNDGYTLVGEQDFTCENDGNWSPSDFPICIGECGEYSFSLYSDSHLIGKYIFII